MTTYDWRDSHNVSADRIPCHCIQSMPFAHSNSLANTKYTNSNDSSFACVRERVVAPWRCTVFETHHFVTIGCDLMIFNMLNVWTCFQLKYSQEVNLFLALFSPVNYCFAGAWLFHFSYATATTTATPSTAATAHHCIWRPTFAAAAVFSMWLINRNADVTFVHSECVHWDAVPDCLLGCRTDDRRAGRLPMPTENVEKGGREEEEENVNILSN